MTEILKFLVINRRGTVIRTFDDADVAARYCEANDQSPPGQHNLMVHTAVQARAAR